MSLNNLNSFKLNKVQMNNVIGGISAVCTLMDADGKKTPVEINTNIEDMNHLSDKVAKYNKGYTVTECVRV